MGSRLNGARWLTRVVRWPNPGNEGLFETWGLGQWVCIQYLVWEVGLKWQHEGESNVRSRGVTESKKVEMSGQSVGYDEVAGTTRRGRGQLLVLGIRIGSGHFKFKGKDWKLNVLTYEIKQASYRTVCRVWLHECINLSQPVEWRVPRSFLVKSMDLGLKNPEFAFLALPFTSFVILGKSLNPSV